MLHSSAPRGAPPAKEAARARDTGNTVNQHRRSRESPGDDSETDDSEFQAPQHQHASRSSLEHFKSNQARASSERDHQRPSTAGVGGRLGERVQEGGEASPGGVVTAYNTYRNAGLGVRRSSDASAVSETR